jgi:site-specific DNA recombinase
MRLGAYVRVSRVGGRTGDSFISPSEQAARVEHWCHAHGHTLAETMQDLDVSGAATQRPQLEGLLEGIESGRLDGLIVAKLDRFARNISSAVTMLDRIDRAGGQFVSVSEGFDSTTPAGRLTMNMLLSFAQFELERYREQWAVAVTRMIDRGVHPGPVAPVGYQRGPRGPLEPDEQAPFVTELFKRRAAGESVSALTRWLQDTSLRTSHGGQATRRLVDGVLRNRVYLGEARSGELINRDAHEPLTDEVTFARANQLHVPRPPRQGPPALLAGLVRCQGCRYAMAPVMRDGKRRYRCLGVQNQRKCPAPAFVTEHELLPIVERVLWTWQDEIIVDAAGEAAALEDAQQARDEARHVKEQWRDDPAVQAAMALGDYLAGLQARQALEDQRQRELDRLLGARPSGLPDATTLRGVWPAMSVEHKRLVLAQVFDAIVIRKHPSRSRRLAILDRVLFIPHGTLGLEDLPRGGNLGGHVCAPFDWPRDPTGAGVLGGKPVLE